MSRVLDEERSTEQQTGTVVNTPWEEHLEGVYRYALRLTHDQQQACDLTQDTMLRGWSKKQAVRDPAAMRVWLLRIATNLWRDWLRSKKPQPQLLEEPTPSPGPSIPGKLIQQEHVQQALAALDRLPPRQRQVMHLITIEQLSHDEVAQILELSPAAVKANLAAGRKEMRKQLREIYEDVCGVKQCQND